MSDPQTWLVLCLGLFLLTPWSMYLAFAFGWDFDPDDYPGSYYEAQIPRRIAVTAVTVAVPALAALTAGISAWLSLSARPIPLRALAAALLALLPALAATWITWTLGTESVANARRFAEIFAG